MLENKVYRVKPTIALQKISDNCFRAYDIVDGDVFELNETSYRMLLLLSQGNTPQGVVQAFLSEYAVDRDELERDVEGLIAQALREGIIEEHV